MPFCLGPLRSSVISALLLLYVASLAGACSSEKEEADTTEVNANDTPSVDSGKQPTGTGSGSNNTPATDPIPWDPGIPPTTTAAVKRIDLSAFGTPAAMICFPIFASGIGNDGSPVLADQDVTFTVTQDAGSGAIFSNSNCTAPATGGTITQGEPKAVLFYKTTDQGPVSLKATYNGEVGTAFSETLGAPLVSVSMTKIEASSCSRIQVGSTYNSTYMAPSNTHPLVLSITQTSGNVTGVFYETEDCSGTPLTTGSDSILTIPAGQSGKVFSFDTNSNGGSYTFSGSWICGSTTKPNLTFGFLLL